MEYLMIYFENHCEKACNTNLSSNGAQKVFNVLTYERIIHDGFSVLLEDLLEIIDVIVLVS